MMWWQVLNAIFGWHFVHLENFGYQLIRRVRYTGNGKPFVHYYGAYLIWLDQPDGWTVTFLTHSMRTP